MAGVYQRYAASRRKQRAWAASNPGNRAIRAELSAALFESCAAATGSGGHLLDAGCGSGWWLRALLASGISERRLHGVDLLPTRLRRAALPEGVDLRAADVRALPYADMHFEAVFMLTLLSSLPSSAAVAEAVGEAWRVLRPGGVLACYEPRLPSAGSPRRHVSRRELEDVLGPPISVRSLTLLPPLARRLGGLTHRLYPRLARVRLLRTHRLWLFERR